MAVNDIAPSTQTLGTMNAIALTLSSALRSVVPALATSLFAVGVRYQILHGQLAWIVLSLSTVILAVSLRWLPAKAEGKTAKKEVDEEANGSNKTQQPAENGNGHAE